PAGPPPVAAGAPARAVGGPGLGGLLLSFCGGRGGQRLAQPGMLVVHVPPLPLAAGADLHLPGAHGQDDPVWGVRVDTGLALPNPRRSSPPSSQHEPVGAARLGVDLEDLSAAAMTLVLPWRVGLPGRRCWREGAAPGRWR